MGSSLLINHKLFTEGTATPSTVLSGYTFGSANSGSLQTGTIASQAAQTITPSTTNQIISSGKYLSGDQTIKGDSNLVAANIASGVSIFGVTGTHSGGTDTSDATLSSSSQMLSGYTAYSKGTKYTGNISSKSATTYNTSTSNQTISSGYYLSGDQTIRAVTTSNISASNIKHGVTIKVGDAGSSTRIANVTGTYYNDGNTYTLSNVGTSIDMGSTSSNRYITTSGLYKLSYYVEANKESTTWGTESFTCTLSATYPYVLIFCNGASDEGTQAVSCSATNGSLTKLAYKTLGYNTGDYCVDATTYVGLLTGSKAGCTITATINTSNCKSFVVVGVCK